MGTAETRLDALVDALLAPIPGDHPGGVDVAFAPEVDAIREARREDDGSLAQGEWEAPLKVADWPRVVALCEHVLRNQSKDLQVAAWYTEARTRLAGFAGLTSGLRLIDGLITDFWEFAHPLLEGEDLEERAAKIEWLNVHLAEAVRRIPLVSPAAGGYGWLEWEESRQVENLGLKDPQAREQAIAEGRLSGEAFEQAARASGEAFSRSLREDIAAAAAALATLERHVEERFGTDAPSLRTLGRAIADCAAVAGRMAAQFEIPSAEATVPSPEPLTMQSAPMPTPSPASRPVAAGAIASRVEAIAALHAVARYFRANEPHSPVALLAERAARWAEMPLEAWLASVIKDEATLGQLRELLGVTGEGGAPLS